MSDKPSEAWTLSTDRIAEIVERFRSNYPGAPVTHRNMNHAVPVRVTDEDRRSVSPFSR